MGSLQKLAQAFDTLFIDAEKLDKRRGKHYAPLFDEQLFHCQAALLVPCVEEAKLTFDELSVTQQNITKPSNNDASKDLSKLEYLASRLVDQFAAIQRELSTVALRQSESKPSANYRKPLKALYKDLEQHREWETRLKAMVIEKQKAFNDAMPQHYTQAQQALMATQERLQRCQASKYKIEHQIHYREKHRHV